MSKKTFDWNLIVTISAVGISLAGFIFSVLSFNAIQKAKYKPLLRTHSENYINQKSIQVVNHGNGAAVISSARFCRPKKKCTNKIVELFDLPKQVIWDDYHNMPSGIVIASGKRIVLVKLTLQHLRNYGFSSSKAKEILNTWQIQKSQITVKVVYKDILGNTQPVMSNKL